jgi:2-C-methyl-D-erythritol 4-phosphate cytidylyltransferase
VPLGLGIIPVLLDDGEAPQGGAALRVLRGVPLVRRSVGSLLRSGAVDRVVVAVPAALVPAVTAALEPGPGDDVRVLAAGDDLQPLLVALDAVGDAPAVLLHDPLDPLAPAALALAVARALAAEGDRAAAAVPVGPVTDTLKWVGEQDLVTGTADRSRFRQVGSPQAYRPGPLLDALRAAPAPPPGSGPEAVPLLVQGRGGHVIGVPAGIASRITSAADLVLAEAMLDAGAATDEEAPASS